MATHFYLNCKKERWSISTDILNRLIEIRRVRSHFKFLIKASKRNFTCLNHCFVEPQHPFAILGTNILIYTYLYILTPDLTKNIRHPVRKLKIVECTSNYGKYVTFINNDKPTLKFIFEKKFTDYNTQHLDGKACRRRCGV